MSEGFMMTPWLTMVFFRYCMRYKVTDKQERVDLLRRLVAKKKSRYIRDVEEEIKDKRVVVIKPKEV